MTGLGTLLQEAREEQGLSIADIAERTNIRPQFLQAMEEGNFQLLPDQAYIRPFLRTYARALGLDAEQIVLEFNAKATPLNAELSALQERRAQLKALRRRKFFWRLGALIIVFAGAAFAIYKLFFV